MRMNRSSVSLLVLSFAASAVVGLGATASAAPSAKAVGYWTQERLDSAQAIELVVDATTGVGKKQISPAAGKPGGSAKNSPGVLQTTDWPQGQPIAQTAVGKVFFSVGTSNYVCSGALVTDSDPNRAIVLTAGHCVWDDLTRAFVTNFAFFPNYDAGDRNSWMATALVVRQEFSDQSTFNSTALANDFAFAVLTTNSNTAYLPDLGYPANSLFKNSYDLNVNGFVRGYTAYAFGYPQAKPYNGLTLKYAGSPIALDTRTNTTWGMSSSMTGGASGGPWLSNGTSTSVDATTGKLSSLNSYKYDNDATKMYGPIFNLRTTALYQAALTAITDQKISN